MQNRDTMIQNLTTGSVSRQLIRFSLPFLAANMLQLLYSLVDMAFVGQANGSVGLSAVSIGSQITMLFTQISIGLTTGSQVCISHLVGSDRRDRIQAAVGTTLTWFSLIAFVLTAVGIGFCRPILRLVNTPEEAMDQAAIYLVICSAGMFFIFGYNSLCAVLRGMGDSDRPLAFVAIATAVNIILDYLFVLVLGLGAAGAAAATIAGQAVACVCALIYLYRRRVQFGFDFRPRSFLPARDLLLLINKLGIPLAFQKIAVSTSMIYMNAWINTCGLAAVATAGIGSKLSSIVSMFTNAFAASVASMVGQNMGAGRVDRVPRIVYTAWAICISCAVAICVLFQIFPVRIFRLFTSDAEVLALAPSFMRVMIVLILAFALMDPPIGLANGVGNTTFNMVVGIVDGVFGRITFSLLFGYVLGMGLNGYFLGNGLAGYISVICSAAYFFFGHWRERTVVPSGSGK